MAEKLTKRVVDAAEPREQRYTIYDSLISGFGLRVTPSGEKSWIFEYRPGDGGRHQSKKRITIGRIGDFTADQARKAAETYRSQVKLGGDPQGEKASRRKALTFAEVARLFLSDHVDAKRKVSTAAWYRDLFERVVIPKLGSTKAADVTRNDVAKLHLSLKSTSSQANRALAAISSMYSFADRQGLITEEFNPAKRIERYREEGRERYLSSEELARLGSAIRKAETDGLAWDINPNGKTKHVAKKKQTTTIDPFAAAALRLLIFTGARLREILHLKWQHVDFDRGLLMLPDSKTGKKVIVLNAPALAVLASIDRLGGYVIAGASAATEDEKPRADLKRPWEGVRREAGLEDVRIHDLRHNFAAFGAGGGMGLPLIGKLLGHSQPATTARYAHLDADPVRRASDTIASGLALAMGEGAADKLADANIVVLHKKREQ
ncbi:tyrosine-type recombinase/integrase [Sinorhizobium medicae]|uniref:tyrosine-type recombinase/integrase n=1 Tax=Sinorhizobium medicae TaxID=110321 RepID=UPI000C7CCC07|nr:site-specific integrase [Sinorhizobium medicae]PLU02963.1 integrase [Sinorhizobium medicae]PLU57743.1 integrase [Sinorhizobium medicae]PLU70379.1 integrase [Sinorhizobium medicae]PLU83212.1 integrase [Sinorhizobium medicae]